MGKLKLVIRHRGCEDQLVLLHLECGHSVVRRDRGVAYPSNEAAAREHARAFAAGERNDAPIRAFCPKC